MQILESIASLFKNTVKPELPLHYGEVMTLWTLLAALQEARQICVALLSHTEDAELKRIIERSVKDIKEPGLQEVARLLQNEGVPIPQSSPDKPKTDPAAVPAGAKLTDAEAAQLVVAKMEGLLAICGGGMLQALRDDVATLLLRYQMNLLGEGLVLKKTMKQRGWLKVPPLHYAPVKQ